MSSVRVLHEEELVEGIPATTTIRATIAETVASAGSSTFIGLSDVPANYTGDSLKVVRVNVGETALEFVTLSGGGDALVANPLSQFAATTSLQLKNTISDETGSGALVFANTPTLVTPVLGAATATSINGATITSGALNGSVTGTNTGDQTTIVGITGTKAQFNTAVTDGNIMYIGDAPTAHTHLLAAGATDVTSSAAELNILDGATLTVTELNYVDGVTSAIQTQLDARVFKNAVPCEFIVACSDETTAITAGTAKVTFRAPYAFTLTAVRASVTTAPTGATIIIDINEGGTTVLSTKISIDTTEKTSTTAATPAVISDSAIADDAEITIDFDQVGSTIAGAGVKVYLIGTHAT